MIHVANVNQFDTYCRICSCCVDDKNELTSIFESADLLEKMTSCLPIIIHEEDKLPHQICKNCLNMIENSFDLIKKAQNSERYFYNFFNNEEDKKKKLKEDNSSKEYDDRSQCYRHLGSLNLAGSLQCDLCGIKLNEIEDLDTHIQEHHFNQAAPPNTEFTLNKICSLCGQLFDGEEAYVLHKCETYHKCTDCGKIMPNKCLLNRHIQHSCKLLYYCPYCHKTFTAKLIFLKHVQDHTGEESKSGCLACDKKTNISGEITEHTCVQTIEDDSAPKKFKCYICGQAYLRQLSLAKHCLTHEPKSDWKYKCLKCGESFEKERTLQIHYAKIHKISRAWVCRFCGKSLSTKLSLQIHERIHTKVKPYVCEWCGNAFRCKPNLIQHQAIHTGIRKHGCQVCGKMFSRPFFLKTHLRVHTGERPYQCDICDRRFTQLTDMRRHRRRHDKTMPTLSGHQPTAHQTMIVVTEDGQEIPAEFFQEVTVDSFPGETVELKVETSYE